MRGGKAPLDADDASHNGAYGGENEDRAAISNTNNGRVARYTIDTANPKL